MKKYLGDLAGTYYPLTGMEEKVRQQLVDDHFLFVSGKNNTAEPDSKLLIFYERDNFEWSAIY